MWGNLPRGEQVHNQIDQYKESNAPMRGIEGQAYVCADQLIQLEEWFSLKHEMIMGVIESERQYTSVGYGSHPSVKWVDIDVAIRYGLSRDPDHYLRKDLESFDSLLKQRLYAKLAMKAIAPGFGVTLRSGHGEEGWNNKNFSAACEWTDNAKHFPKLIQFLNKLPFSQYGRVHIFYQDHFCPTPCHSDHSIKYRAHHSNEFLWMQFDLNKRFYIYDSANDKKHYVKHHAIFFNEMDFHGADPSESGSFSLRIDGVFTDEFRRALGISSACY